MATFTWIGGTLGTWNDSTDWSGKGGSPGPTDVAVVPGANGISAIVDVLNGPGGAATLIATGGVALNGVFDFQDVVIDPTGTLNIGSDDTLRAQDLDLTTTSTRLVVNGGTVQVNDTLRSHGELLFRNGALVEAGAVIINSGEVTLSANSNLTVTTGTFLINGGHVTLDVTASLNVGTAAPATPGMVVVDAGHALAIADDSVARFDAHAFLNNGTISSPGYGPSYYSPPIEFTSGTNNGVMTGVTLRGGYRSDGSVDRITNNGTIFSGLETYLEFFEGPGTVATLNKTGSGSPGIIAVGPTVEALVDFSPGLGLLRIDQRAFGFGFTPTETASVDLTLRDFGTDDVVELPYQVTGATYSVIGAHLGQLTFTTERGILNLTFDGDYVADPSLEFANGTVLRLGAAGLYMMPVCFGPGTRIATARGDVAVEDLRIGDQAVVAPSGQTRPVIWIGYRTIDLTHHHAPDDIRPVRIRAGAFAPNRPERDLILSPNHAIHAEDSFIPVKYLINGTSIAPVDMDRITYWHVELDQHDVLLAEGLGAESYLDTGDRSFFANAGPVVAMHPTLNAWTWDARARAPLAVTGPVVERVRAVLAERAGAETDAQRRHG